MKQIVNGVTYNTDTATLLAERQDASLLQTRGGAFFAHEKHERKVWNQRDGVHERRAEEELRPLSPAEAQDWIMSGHVKILHNPFEDPPEAAAEPEAGATIYIRVPASLKKRVDKAATLDGVSGNAWAMRCVEKCLEGPNWQAENALADAYYCLMTIRSGSYNNKNFGNILEEATDKVEDCIKALGYETDDFMLHTSMNYASDFNNRFPWDGES